MFDRNPEDSTVKATWVAVYSSARSSEENLIEIERLGDLFYRKPSSFDAQKQIFLPRIDLPFKKIANLVASELGSKFCAGRQSLRSLLT